MRSKVFDGALRRWLADHPSAAVVELGAGLETQFQRCDNGSVRWLCVVTVMFDTIPPHFAGKTLEGHGRTAHAVIAAAACGP